MVVYRDDLSFLSRSRDYAAAPELDYYDPTILSSDSDEELVKNTERWFVIELPPRRTPISIK